MSGCHSLKNITWAEDMPNFDACSISGGHFGFSLGRNLKLRLKVNQDFRDQSCAPDVYPRGAL